jgi:5-methyltetrahydrofolate--homocysteine methyltransferase
MLNSITGEADRLAQMLPLAVEFGAKVVALAMDDSGMPETIDARFAALETILAAVDAAGVKRENLYVDPLIRPVSTNPTHALDCLSTIRRIKSELAPVKTTGGMSNISFGLPKRGLLNRVFLAYAVEAGIDAGILDPLEPGAVATIRAAEAILNRDEFCLRFITADREGLLEA